MSILRYVTTRLGEASTWAAFAGLLAGVHVSIDLSPKSHPSMSRIRSSFASDITDRLFSAALREAYSADRDLRIDDLITAAKALEPSPSMTRHHASD